jgi:hypothetical protein
MILRMDFYGTVYTIVFLLLYVLQDNASFCFVSITNKMLWDSVDWPWARYEF